MEKTVMRSDTIHTRAFTTDEWETIVVALIRHKRGMEQRMSEDFITKIDADSYLESELEIVEKLLKEITRID